MALEIERDARVHKLQSAPREPALPLMTCDAACARLVDIARVSCSGVTVLDAHLRYRVSRRPVIRLRIKRRAKRGRTPSSDRDGVIYTLFSGYG